MIKNKHNFEKTFAAVETTNGHFWRTEVDQLNALRTRLLVLCLLQSWESGQMLRLLCLHVCPADSEMIVADEVLCWYLLSLSYKHTLITFPLLKPAHCYRWICCTW